MLQKVNYEIFNETKEDWETMHVENEGNDLNKTIQKQVDFNVKELTLIGRDIMSIREGEIQENFDKVEILQLIKDEYANIPIQILQEFNNLEKLILKVSSYEEIFLFGEDKEHTGAFTKLKDLELHGLFNLKCIWKQDFRLNSILQNLDRLVVQYCPSLTVLLPSLASFENITSLRVRYCNGMQNLMSSSTAKSLVRLEELTIVGCEMMTKVLANEGDIEKAEIVFKKLRNLHFHNLESLTCFCSGNYTLEFPFLENLFVSACLKMKTFSGGGLSMPRLKYLNFKGCSKSDIDTIIKQLQNDCSEFINAHESMW
ncbi:uncharacterized protein LOC116139462 [Pistacia vera]|uniref:uncharacterized protein LOC116139462 n=1 Tax=Pistacia vera TaxID=55513 RepID=UPI0012635C3A|nr:uncharacterized protein LOC116139462 [Pistacia vera]